MRRADGRNEFSGMPQYRYRRSLSASGVWKEHLPPSAERPFYNNKNKDCNTPQSVLK